MPRPKHGTVLRGWVGGMLAVAVYYISVGWKPAAAMGVRPGCPGNAPEKCGARLPPDEFPGPR